METKIPNRKPDFYFDLLPDLKIPVWKNNEEDGIIYIVSAELKDGNFCTYAEKIYSSDIKEFEKMKDIFKWSILSAIALNYVVNKK